MKEHQKRKIAKALKILWSSGDDKLYGRALVTIGELIGKRRLKNIMHHPGDYPNGDN